MITSTNTDLERVCLIIPTFNSWLSTAAMMRNILNNQFLKNMSIVVVDAGSEDYIKLRQEFEREIRSGKIILIHIDKDLGGSGSFYVGLKYCLGELRCDIIILSDNDARPLSNTLVKSLIKEVKNNNNMVVRPRNFNYDIPNWFLFHFLTIPRKCLEKVNLDNIKDYFIHQDDYALVTELKLHGCEVKKVNEWYSHPMTFPRIYYYLRNVVFQYLHRPEYHIKLKDVVLTSLASLIQASYIGSHALKAAFVGFFHGIKGHLGKEPGNLAKLSLIKFGKGINASHVNLFIYASHDKPTCRNLRSNIHVHYAELLTDNPAKQLKFLIKCRGKVIATDVGFTVFSILLLIAKKVILVVYDPFRDHYYCKLREYMMHPLNKLFSIILLIVTVPLITIILLLSKLHRKFLSRVWKH